MTMHTRAATDEIYELFNAPLKPAHDTDADSDEDEYMTEDGDYTSDAESTGTTRQITTSEAGDDETSDEKSVSEWSDFTARKHIPGSEGEDADEDEDEDDAENLTRVSQLPDDVDMPEEDEDDPDIEDSPPRTRFIPIPPEDYDPPTRPYRDPVEVANNRLPFMTPITERTETSLGMVTAAKSYYGGKTPSKIDSFSTLSDDEEDDEAFEPLSSPLREILSEARSPVKVAQPLLKKSVPAVSARPVPAKKATAPKGPIIKDAQCNPVDKAIREEILANMQPPLTSYPGFYDHRSERFERGAEIRRFTKAMAARAGKNGNDKTSTVHTSVVLEFPELMCEYTIKRELGAGAFAPVYLVENSSPESDEGGNGNDENSEPLVVMGKGAFATAHARRQPLEALKMEQPPTAWEFHMMRLAAARLGPQHRAAASVSPALEMHLYQDDGFLFLPYHPYGTLLDVVNHFRAVESSQVMDEQLAMFFSIELLRTVEALHAKQILHGDIKADNCLLRLDPLLTASGHPSGPATATEGQGLSSQWRADGSGGWASRGIVLIDFGRGIDMRAFVPGVQFIADWRTTAQDCAEAREGRPWSWQLDYHGLAGAIHCLLFGKYIDAVRADGVGGGVGLGSERAAVAGARRYRIRESLKRYWQTDIWAECFDVLLNPGSHIDAEDTRSLPVTRSLRRVRERMEAWLETNCERGVGLRALMGRVEAMAKGRK